MGIHCKLEVEIVIFFVVLIPKMTMVACLFVTNIWAALSMSVTTKQSQSVAHKQCQLLMDRVLFGCGVLLSSRVLFANAFWRAFWLIELRQPLLVETQPTLARRLKK